MKKNTQALPTDLQRKALITRLGETDQISLNAAPVFELQHERIDLRLQLAQMSVHVPEQHYFMLQAVGLSESLCMHLREQLAGDTAAIPYDEIQEQLVHATVQLFAVYLLWFRLSNEAKYLMIAEQVIKPVSHINNRSVYAAMVSLYQAKASPALLLYWQKKWLQLDE